jgi:bifunctional non-homologous end joining protein LigD
MNLTKYKSKRNLKLSGEPAAKIKTKRTKKLIFVIQEHHASHLHYDFRLEVDGVLKSWAVPKEPTMDPSIKRLAVEVEDHPYDYKDFEGQIPSGYGAGTVEIWDKGTYQIDDLDAKETEKRVIEGFKKGGFHFSLYGKKLKGEFSLIRLKKSANKNEWLLIKKKEEQPKDSLEFSSELTNLDKIYWPKEKITKGELIQYYHDIAPWILPYLKDRPVSLRRYPNGITGEKFFQKNVVKHPHWIETIPVKHPDKTVHYMLIQNIESLLYVANLGCIELHPFFSRVQNLLYPDFLVFDLDPKSSTFEKVILIAQALHKLLDDIGVPSFCKTSGATGLHIVVPLQAQYLYEQAREFAKRIGLKIRDQLPEIATLERSIQKRSGKVYIDCYQNNFSQTLACVYGVRARPKAPVSTPLHWSEVTKGLNPMRFTMKTIFERLDKLGDLFSPVLGKGADLTKALQSL